MEQSALSETGDVLLTDCCVIYGLAITSMTFEHGVVHTVSVPNTKTHKADE